MCTLTALYNRGGDYHLLVKPDRRLILLPKCTFQSCKARKRDVNFTCFFWDFVAYDFFVEEFVLTQLFHSTNMY